MKPTTRSVMWTFAGAALVAAAASALTLLAESKLNPAGTYRVVVTGGNPTISLPHLATFMSDGGVIGSVIPVNCLDPDQSLSEAHGAWSVRVKNGVPVLTFHLEADIYRRLAVQQIETTYNGTVTIDGSAPLGFGAVTGAATMTFPPQSGCAQVYSGKVAFTAEEILVPSK